MSALLVPVLLATVCLYALLRRTDVMSAMVAGAGEGLNTVVRILPALVVLLTAVAMLRASGAVDALCSLLRPVLRALGIPPELSGILFLRPFSGSGALAVASDVIAANGPDSFVGRCAAVMLGSTETTFYVISVYFGACKIKKSRQAIPAAIAADLTGFILSALTVRLFF